MKALIKSPHFEIKPQFRFTLIRTVWDFNWNDGFVFDGETHISWEIVYVASGSVHITEEEKLYTLHEGDMIIHAPMEFHTIRSAEGTSPNVYVITVIAEGSLPQNLTDGVLSLDESEREEYRELFRRLYSFFHAEERDALLGQECTDYLSSFLIRVNYRHTARPKLSMSHSASEYNKIVQSMSEHIYDNCTLEEIADYNCTSVSNIKALFRKYSGISPKMHYARLRCTEAIRLMGEGKSAAETANMLNFSSPNYFNTFFKRMTGKPPASFIRGSTGIYADDPFGNFGRI